MLRRFESSARRCVISARPSPASRQAVRAVTPAGARALHALRSVAANNQTAQANAQTPQTGSRALATGLSQASTPVPASSVFAPLGAPAFIVFPPEPRSAADSARAFVDTFTRRHVGPQEESVQKMLAFLGYESLDAFIDDCVPPEIRLEADALADHGPNGIRALSESELLRRAKEIGKKNQVTRSFIGMGYHQAVSPRPSIRCSSQRREQRADRRCLVECRCCRKLSSATCSRTTGGSRSTRRTRLRFRRVSYLYPRGITPHGRFADPAAVVAIQAVSRA